MHTAEGTYGHNQAWFCTTQWTVVLKASNSGPESSRALERLCETYWYPLYSFVRRKGRTPEDAQDLVQGFFAHLLAGDRFAGIDAAKGKFRTFLLTSMTNYLANDCDRANRIKRGGGIQFVSMDAPEAEGKYKLELVEQTTPETLFERNWAQTVISNVARQLKDEYARAGEGHRFTCLKEFLMGGGDSRYAAIASELAMSEGGVKTCVRRLRLRFRDLLRKELAQTVEDPREIDEEIRQLLLAFAGLRNS